MIEKIFMRIHKAKNYLIGNENEFKMKDIKYLEIKIHQQ